MKRTPPIYPDSLPDPLIILEQIKKSEAEISESLKEIETLLHTSMNSGVSSISKKAIAVITGGRIEGNNFYLPKTQLDRKLYQEVNEVLENAGGKWNRGLKAHTFLSDPSLKIQAAIETQKTVNEKIKYQFFETPTEVVNRMLELAEIQYTEDPERLQDVLEPSAGHGAIADKIDGSRCLLRCSEIDPGKVRILMDKGYPVFCGDFLTQKNEEFDRIIMNPPFTKQQDIDHVMHAWSLLRQGGRLVAIMSPSFTYRTNKKSAAFKEMVEEYGCCEELPEGSFKDSGTSVRTVIVTLNKPILN